MIDVVTNKTRTNNMFCFVSFIIFYSSVFCVVFLQNTETIATAIIIDKMTNIAGRLLLFRSATEAVPAII